MVQSAFIDGLVDVRIHMLLNLKVTGDMEDLVDLEWTMKKTSDIDGGLVMNATERR